MNIFFSPIGGTDPISNFRDGAMLHICRHYKPDKVYLYLSKEMCQFHDNNNRYIYCLDKLGAYLGHAFEYKIIRRDDLENVQLFDYFIGEFKDLINQILAENDADKVIVNVSSGTPAMKSALLMLSVLYPDKCIPIQVSTPARRMNPHDEDKYKYDVEGYWSVNEDNELDTENRCTEAVSHNWLLEIKKETAVKQIAAYDYVAALSVLEDCQKEIDADTIQLIRAAAHRLKLDFSKMDKELKELPVDFIPVKEGNIKSIIEYALTLQIKLQKEEYADFLRALSPLFKDLYEIILNKECNIDVEKDLTSIIPNSKSKKDYNVKKESRQARNLSVKRYRWDVNKLQQHPDIHIILQTKYNKFTYGDVGNDHLRTLVIGLCKNQSTIEKMKCLEPVERVARNSAAHNIISITDEKIKALTGISTSEIMNIIKTLLDQYVIKGRKNVWISYDDMNQVIIDQLIK